MQLRIRTVKPQLFKHERLFDLEKETGLPIRFAWIGLFAIADREGRFDWRPRTLKAEILPYDEGVDFAYLLEVLERAGMVVKYQLGSEAYGWIPTFHIHQRVNIREAQSLIPEPPPELVAMHVRAHACTDNARAEGKGKEGKGTEGVEEPPAPAVSDPPGEEFGILPILAGNSKRDQVLPLIAKSLQQEWVDRYDPGWLKDSLLHAIDNYAKGKSIESIDDWPGKLIRWFKIEKHPKFRPKPPAEKPRAPVIPWDPKARARALSDPRLAAVLSKMKSV